jgi:hypothetical protein
VAEPHGCAKIYYLARAYVYLLAAGAVPVDGWLAVRRRRVALLAIATTLVTLVFTVAVLPVLPMRKASGDTLVETIGWPALVASVRGVWNTLRPAQQGQTVIFTEEYAEAAAVNELARGTGLLTAVSGWNSEWWRVRATRARPQ